MSKIIQRIFYFIGLLCTMTAIAIPGIGLAVYNLLFPLLYVTVIINHIENKRAVLYYSSRYRMVYIFFLLMIISAAIACVTLPEPWYKNSVAMTFKFIMFGGGILFLFSQSEIKVAKNVFMKGLYHAAYLQLMWGILQVLWWELFTVNINDQIFGQMLHIGQGTINWNQNIMGGIVCRMSGFSWEPAAFAIVMLIGWILAKKRLSKGLFLVAILLSTSRTGLLALLVISFVKFFSYLRTSHFHFRLSLKMLVEGAFAIVIAIGLASYYYDALLYAWETITRTWDALIVGITTTDNDSANIHKLYYIELLDLLLQSDWYNVLFGYGTFSAGYAYELSGIVHMMTIDTWNPETDFVTIMVGNGILGWIGYYSIAYTAWKKQMNPDNQYLIMAVVITGITYLFIRGTWTFLLVLLLFASPKTLIPDGKQSPSTLTFSLKKV